MRLHVATVQRKNNMDHQFAAGCDVGYLGDKRYAITPMGLFDDLEAAVLCTAELHSSFGYVIYKVSKTVTKNVPRAYGISQGGKHDAHLILDTACYAFDHPAWPKKSVPIIT